MNTEREIRRIVRAHWPDEVSELEKKKQEQREIGRAARIEFGISVGSFLRELGVKYRYAPGFFEQGVDND